MNQTPEKIAIMGAGVMGGSLLLALRESSFSGRVHLYARSEQARKWAAENGADAVFGSPEELHQDEQLVFLATPSWSYKALVPGILKAVSKEALVSDMASAKSEVIPLLDSLLREQPYLSCHPMTGSEKIGLDGVDSKLYQNKKLILTPHSEQSRTHLPVMRDFFEALGMTVSVLPPDTHDRMVAWASHMPHLLISALVQGLRRGQDETASPFDVAGTGLRDISRLAASNPDLWRDIVMENRPAIRAALRGMCDELCFLTDLLEKAESDNGDRLRNYLQEAKKIHREKGLGK